MYGTMLHNMAQNTVDNVISTMAEVRLFTYNNIAPYKGKIRNFNSAVKNDINNLFVSILSYWSQINIGKSY